MENRWKRIVLTTTALSILQTTAVWAADVNMNLFYQGKNHAYHAKEIKLNINGKNFKDPNMPAVSIDGRTMLPMRGICKELGCEITWNDNVNEAYATKDGHTIVFAINKKTGYKDGTPFTMDVAPMIINERTMLPVRALADALDVDIQWDDETRTVYIREEGQTAPPQQEKPPVTPPVTTEPQEKPQEKPPIAPPVTPKPQQNARLTNVTVPQQEGEIQHFVISANGALGKYEEVFVSDNKVILDFYDAENGLPETITNTGCSFVTAIRTGQHTKVGKIYTRVVFDLTGKQKYTVKASDDKSQVFVDFIQTKVTDISATHQGNEDVVTIKGSGPLGAKVSTLQNPYRIVVDMPNVLNMADTSIGTVGLENIHVIRTNKGKGNLFQVVLEAEDFTDMKWEEKDGVVTIRVAKSTLQNISYDNSRNILLLKAERDININAIQHNDAYLQGYYELTLPGNYENVYGYGNKSLEDDKISSIAVNTKGGNTVIRFNQNTVNAYTVQKTDGYYEIAVRNPKEIYDKVLVLDAGHGGNDPGTNGNGLVEKNIALSIAMKIDRYIKANSNIKVYVTRNDDARPANKNRAKMANEIADVMLSIHLNAGAVQANGTETLYAKHSNDNDGTLTSLQLAQNIQKNLTAGLHTTNRGVKQRPDLLILNSTHVPAVLVEVCFLSNPGDALKIASDEGQEKAATAIGQAVVQTMNTSRLR